jgi:hypothetical protein
LQKDKRDLNNKMITNFDRKVSAKGRVLTTTMGSTLNLNDLPFY